MSASATERREVSTRLGLLAYAFRSDLIATGGSAAAAGQLVKQAGGKTLEYLFIVSLPFLNGHKLLDAPMYAMIEAED